MVTIGGSRQPPRLPVHRFKVGDVVRLKSDTPKSPDMTVAQLHPQQAGVVGCVWRTTSGKPEDRAYHEDTLVLVQPEAPDAKPK